MSPSLLVNSSNFMLANSPPLLAKNPWDGNPTLIHQESINAVMIVSAFLFGINFPWINHVKESIIHNMYLESNSLRYSVTTSLKDQDFGNVTLGLATNLLNF